MFRLLLMRKLWKMKDKRERKKESAMNELKKTVVQLIKRVHLLELAMEKEKNGEKQEGYQEEVV